MMKASDSEEAGSVVLGFEGGWRMKNLLHVAVEEAARRETTLAIVTVSRPVLDPELNISGRQAAETQAETRARRHLSEAMQFVHAMREQLSVTTHYITEEQAHAACHPLSSSQLLVVGTVGRHGRSAFSLESVSRVLLKAIRCPVLVVPDEGPAGSGARKRLVVVAGVGEHHYDAAVIQAAAAESFRRQCELELVHSYQNLTAETPGQGLRRAADVTARAVAAAHVPLGVQTSVLLTQEAPAAALSRQTDEALLLVIGSRPGSLSGLVLGSVGREILNSLPCPMLVIPDPVPDRGSSLARTTRVSAPGATDGSAS